MCWWSWRRLMAKRRFVDWWDLPWPYPYGSGGLPLSYLPYPALFPDHRRSIPVCFIGGEELFGSGCLCLISLSLTLIDIEAHPNAAVFSIPSFLAVVESCPAYLGLCSLAFGGEMYSWVIGINLSLCLFNLFTFMTSNASLTDSITSLDKLLEK
ncbi:hypothetical protein DY000_02006240 [Brassica cretica]|uniref:Uncharacterized protein n=1 Tax=Brassica cretica TaxID=69181 RepID=A0ABQ7CC06_BRACR|nr:hypothetical protein DY000_02006240 [Brassica cretica]